MVSVKKGVSIQQNINNLLTRVDKIANLTEMQDLIEDKELWQKIDAATASVQDQIWEHRHNNQLGVGGRTSPPIAPPKGD